MFDYNFFFIVIEGFILFDDIVKEKILVVLAS